LNIVSKKELANYKLKLELVKQTALQVQKDFQLFDLPIEFSGNPNNAYDELQQQITPTIDRLLNLDSTRFFALLYSIDVDESKINDILFRNRESDPAHEITALVLEREFLKVLTRKLLSKGNK